MKQLIALTLAATVLAGCQTTGDGSVLPPIVDKIAEAQAAVRQVCGFVPDEGVVSKILIFFKPDAAGYLAMAQQICATVAGPQLLGRRPSTPKLYNVRITGHFVR